MRPKRIKQLQAKSRNLRVMSITPNKLVVESRSNEFNNHIVTVEFLPGGEVRTGCTCEWSQFRGIACAHTMAALEHLAAQKGRTLSFWLTEDDARRQRHRIFALKNREHPDGEGVWITSRAG